MQNPQHLLRVTLQSIRDAVVTTDQAARVLSLNRAAESMTGWSSAEAAGKPIEEVLNLFEKEPRGNGADRSRRNPAYIALGEGLCVDKEGHSMLVGRDGRRTAVQVTAAPLNDAAGEVEGCVLVLHDVGEAVRLADRMSYLAHHDPLTGLPNRLLLVDRLEQGTKLSDRNSDQLAVIFVDLDHFTRIKTAFGNPLAEEFLKETASRMIAALRESDTVCRLGADEFVIVAPGVKSVADIEAVAAKLLEEIARPYTIPDTSRELTLQTTCTIGIGIYPRDASDAGTLMRLADGAMHQAKRDGRNRYLFAKPDANRAIAAQIPAGTTSSD